MSRRDRSAVLAIVAMMLLTSSPATARPKSVFRSQAVDRAPDLIDDGDSKALMFVAAWTFSGLQAPLAGDPVPTDRGLIASARDGEIVALEGAFGQACWRTLLATSLTLGPIIGDGVIYQAADDERLYALDEQDGRILWSTVLESAASASPTKHGSWLFVPTVAGGLQVVDARDGSVEIRIALPGRSMAPPVIGEQTIIVGTDHGMVVALDLESLKLRWRRYVRHAIPGPALIHDGRVYVVDGDGRLLCLRLKNGKLKWSQKLGSIVTARMLARGPYLYVLCYDNEIYVARRKNGHLMARVRLDHRLDRSAAVYDDHLLVVPFTESAVVELSLPALRAGGRYALDHPGEWFTTAPVVFADRVAVGYGRSAGRIIAFDVSGQANGSVVAGSGKEGDQP